ncbi:MAG: helix-turn-helix transcriptional regulator [Chloroflexota bacterium]
MGETALQRAIRERQHAQRAAVAAELSRARGETDLSLRSIAAGSGIDVGHLSRVLSGTGSLSQDALVAVATALGFHVSFKLFPTIGPRLRDHLQVLMIEALLGILASRWIPRLEVPVWRPVRGVIDLVLQDRLTGDLVAGEGHSRMGAVEAQLRHAQEKADALPSATGWPWQDRPDEPAASRLLLLRSCGANHDLVRMLPATFAAAYPASAKAAVAALRDATAPWPGPAIVWVDVNGRSTRVLDGTPRGLRGAVPGW